MYATMHVCLCVGVCLRVCVGGVHVRVSVSVGCMCVLYTVWPENLVEIKFGGLALKSSELRLVD